MEEEYKTPEEKEENLQDYVAEGTALVLDYIKEILGKYKWKYASRKVLKETADNSKSLLDGVCHSHIRTNRVWESKEKEEVLDTIVHELLEALVCDRALLNNELQRDGELRIFKHDEINKMTDSIMRVYKKSQKYNK